MVVRLWSGYTGCSRVVGVVVFLLYRGRVGERGRVEKSRGRKRYFYNRSHYLLIYDNGDSEFLMNCLSCCLLYTIIR